jgi:hypothetical protein
VSRVLGDAGQNVGQPSLRIDIVHLSAFGEHRSLPIPSI